MHLCKQPAGRACLPACLQARACVSKAQGEGFPPQLIPGRRHVTRVDSSRHFAPSPPRPRPMPARTHAHPGAGLPELCCHVAAVAGRRLRPDLHGGGHDGHVPVRGAGGRRAGGTGAEGWKGLGVLGKRKGEGVCVCLCACVFVCLLKSTRKT